MAKYVPSLLDNSVVAGAQGLGSMKGRGLRVRCQGFKIRGKGFRVSDLKLRVMGKG